MPDEPPVKTEDGRGLLRSVMLARYDALRAKLVKRLGSVDLANDALQDTWLRLETGRGGNVGVVRDPFAFLIRIASNIASDNRVRSQRRAQILEAHAPQSIASEAPDAEHVLMARSDWEAIRRALKALPQRRQAIFLAAWVEETPYADIAAQHGVSIRTVQSEIKQAIEHCAAELEKKL